MLENKSSLLEFIKNLEPRMKSNYMPIVLKLLLESENLTTTTQKIKEKFDLLNFDREDYPKSGNIDTVRKALEGVVIFPDGDGEVKLKEGMLNEGQRRECLQICGRLIARWHYNKITKRNLKLFVVLSSHKNEEYEEEFKKTNSIGIRYDGMNIDLAGKDQNYVLQKIKEQNNLNDKRIM